MYMYIVIVRDSLYNVCDTNHHVVPKSMQLQIDLISAVQHIPSVLGVNLYTQDLYPEQLWFPLK